MLVAVAVVLELSVSFYQIKQIIQLLKKLKRQKECLESICIRPDSIMTSSGFKKTTSFRFGLRVPAGFAAG